MHAATRIQTRAAGTDWANVVLKIHRERDVAMAITARSPPGGAPAGLGARPGKASGLGSISLLGGLDESGALLVAQAEDHAAHLLALCWGFRRGLGLRLGFRLRRGCW